MRIIEETKLDFKDVLFRPKRSKLYSRSQVELEREFVFLHSKRVWKGVPIMASNMDTIATKEMAMALHKANMFTCLHKFYNIDELVEFSKEPFFDNVAITIGMREHDLEFLEKLSKKIEVKFLNVDVANGYSEKYISYISSIRENFPKTTIIAGNVCTPEITEELILKGADIVKVGIGPGSVCTTRKKTGVGFPQFSAVIECMDAAHGLGGLIISDGGCTCPGDVSKAFGGGADFVMLGGMLAGHDECAGDIIEENGIKYKEFYGMSSEQAMNQHYGGVSKYRTEEGKCVKLKCKGPVENTIQDILGGVRSTCTYVGAVKIKYLPKCATFIKVTQQLNEIFTRY